MFFSLRGTFRRPEVPVRRPSKAAPRGRCSEPVRGGSPPIVACTTLGLKQSAEASGADDVRDSEPVRQPDDRAQIAGVLHVVERQRQPPPQPLRLQVAAGYFDQRQRVVRGFEQRKPLHVARGDGLDPGPSNTPSSENILRTERCDPRSSPMSFSPLGDEKSVLRAAAFVGQRADELYVGFCHRCFSTV